MKNDQTETNEIKAASTQGEIWRSKLDANTCIACGVRDGLKWDRNKAPIGHDTPYSLPPLHDNCRCTLEEITNSPTRESMDGQVAADMNYQQWLKQQPEARQDSVLGKERAQLFRQGKVTLEGMLNAQGEEMTLEQLKAECSL